MARATGLRRWQRQADPWHDRHMKFGLQINQFTWPGGGQASLQGNLGAGNVNIYSYTGLWATFRLMGDAERWDPAGSGYNLEWVVRIGGKPATLANGSPVAVRVMLDMGGAPAFFRKGSLAGLRCVSQVAK